MEHIRDWANKIDSNFEKLFFIDIEPNPYERRPDLIHRRGMYKDTLGSEHPWADYQFRPNIAVAMVVVSIEVPLHKKFLRLPYF